MNFHKLSVCTCAIILMFIRQIENASILLLPNPFPSHWSWMVILGERLRQNGHDVYAVVRDAPDITNDFQSRGITTLPYSVPNPSKSMAQKLEENILELFEYGPPTFMAKIKQNYDMMQIIAEEGDHLVRDESFKAKLRSMHFDVAILDGTPNGMYLFIIPYALNLPYISCTMSYMARTQGLPGLPAFHPMTLAPFSDSMNFLERTFSTLLFLLEMTIGKYSFPGPFRNWIKRFDPKLIDKNLHELMMGSDMWFIHQMVPVDYPKVTLPHVIRTGPWNIKPVAKLPLKLENWMNESLKQGVIVFSLGSSTSRLQPWIMHKIFTAFAKTDMRVVGRYDGPISNYSSHNMLLMPWIPQNDLLGHQAARVFVSHCGNNGMYEALYHGVPVVGFPLFGDHAYNCHRLEHKGYGKVLDIGQFTADDLVSAIRQVLTEPGYSERTRRASAIMKSDPQLPLDKAIYWTEHFIDFGADHLKSVSVDFPWYIYFSVDSLLFIGFVCTLFLYLILCVLQSLKVVFDLLTCNILQRLKLRLGYQRESNRASTKTAKVD